jgi:hypothetical protein
MGPAQERAQERTDVSCFGCRHFRVRHDARWPYACEHFGLRSRALPAFEVRRASGEECRAREPREALR